MTRPVGLLRLLYIQRRDDITLNGEFHMNRSIIIAGSSGLVGRETLSALLSSQNISTVYALSRRELNTQHQKLKQIIDSNLSVPAIRLDSDLPDVGVIALGSTIIERQLP